MIFARFDSSCVFSVNLCIVVRNTPPLVRPSKYSRNFARLSTSTTHSSPINFLAVPNCSESWVSRSVRSVISMIVGLANSRLRINILVRKSIVKLFPQPVAPKYVPPLPSPSAFNFECWRMLLNNLCVAKNCG